MIVQSIQRRVMRFSWPARVRACGYTLYHRMLPLSTATMGRSVYMSTTDLPTARLSFPWPTAEGTMKTLFAMIVALFGAALAMAQNAPAKLQFEVVSVRMVQGADPSQVTAGLRMDGAQAHFASLSLKNLIARAYGDQGSLVSGPDWISSQRYDVNAKLPDGATSDQVPEMLQSMLAERFGLKFHRESKETAAYALVSGK